MYGQNQKCWWDPKYLESGPIMIAEKKKKNQVKEKFIINCQQMCWSITVCLEMTTGLSDP